MIDLPVHLGRNLPTHGNVSGESLLLLLTVTKRGTGRSPRTGEKSSLRGCAEIGCREGYHAFIHSTIIVVPVVEQLAWTRVMD